MWRWLPVLGVAVLAGGCGTSEPKAIPGPAVGSQVEFGSADDLYDSAESLRDRAKWSAEHATPDESNPVYLAIIGHRLGTVLPSQQLVVLAREDDAVKVRALHTKDSHPPEREGWVRPWW